MSAERPSEFGVQHQELQHTEDQVKQPSSHGCRKHPSKKLDIESLIRGLLQPPVDDGTKTRKLGVMFRDLRVVGFDIGTAVQHDLASPFYPRSIINYIRDLRHPPVRDIITGFQGVVFPGEMLLVLGRPGSGCSTFLKTLANHRGEYHDVLGDIFYDSFTPKEIEKRYRGDVVYCPEGDVHFPTLTVQETLEFASSMRPPSARANNRSRKVHTAQLLRRLFGLQQVRGTIVGDESLRGISGGEKKRVSIAEVMSARGKLVCWDNSTRGLDSSTALEFIRILRTATDTADVTTVVSIYQAGEQLFELFDKVCLIYEGKMAYFGPAKEAKQYFINMGYEPQNRQTTPDFLVASTDPNARRIQPGFQSIIPRTADEMSAYFKASVYGQLNRSSMDSFCELYVNKSELKRPYDMSATSEHARHAPKSSSYTLSIPMQVHAVMHRRLQILKGGQLTLVVQVGSLIVQALFIGTAFLKLGASTYSYLSRGSVLYFALFCTSILSIVEVVGLFSQRLIVLRHQKGALYYPFIEGLAHTIIDIPISFLSIAAMTIILYFLVGLQRTAQQFFTFLAFMFIVTLVLKACARSIAAFCTSESVALPVSGATVLCMVLYSGYNIPIRDIVGALRWVAYFNPLRYTFESLVVNEFHTISGRCAYFVPYGPGYETVTPVNQVCTTVGSQPSMATVPGDAYIYASYGYSYSNLWKNFGILGVFLFGLFGVLLFFTQYNKRTARDTNVTLYKQGCVPVPVHQAVDEEKVAPGHPHVKQEQSGATDNDPFETERPERVDIFSWKNIHYDISISRGEVRKLLDEVSGYVTPGTLTALMGESGAGKVGARSVALLMLILGLFRRTVLLDVLAQHILGGVMRGDRLVNRYPLLMDFASKTAYVHQMDTHIPESTVREALLFSARLRQPASVPMVEKEAYVEKCLRMCGLEVYADAIVGSLGVEHRKPGTATFPRRTYLRSRFSVCVGYRKFLRELADNGLAILCTIHQPSGELFQLFDRLLLLQKGGQTVYFGDIGEGSMTMIEYFQRNGGAVCPPYANPAEYMLDVIGAGVTATSMTDWNEVWKNSPEAAKLVKELESIHQGQSSYVVTAGTHSEFSSSWIKQLVLLTHRGFVYCWRNPVYVYSRLSVCVFTGLLVGFTHFGVTNSLQGAQGKIFSLLVAVAICVPMAQQFQAKFMESRTVYDVREYPARIFTWSAFLVSQIIIEMPLNILAMTLLFVCWYWGSGFDSSRAGFSYLFFSIVFPLYYITLALAIAVVSPNGIIATALFSVTASFTVTFAGVIQPYPLLGWWKWMYYLSPFTYIIEGIYGQAVGNQLITCASTEFVTLEPPSGMSCGAYMNPFIYSTGGYLANPNATTQCAFCPFRTTNEYMQMTFNISYGRHWKDLVVVVAFAAFNILLMFAGMYVRIHRGMGLKRSFEKD